MRKLSLSLGLSKEAILFDSRLYIVKAIFAIATGYIVGKSLPVARLDMISVLLGVMYNLEPINIFGLKGGVNQLVASTLGAACTGALIILFGINIFTIAISMALTLYVSLKMNWRMVSPVAIFTCIYMIQFVQRNAAGNPSIWLTFRLRIVALGIGILIAILFNYIFSFLYYRNIAYKRLQFAKIQLLKGLEYTENQLESKCEEKGREYVTLFPSIFNDLDLVYSNIETMVNESKYIFKFLESEKLAAALKIVQHFRDINHLAYDINFTMCTKTRYEKCNDITLKLFRDSIEVLSKIDFISSVIYSEILSIKSEKKREFSNGRICANLNSIKSYVDLVVEEVRKL